MKSGLNVSGVENKEYNKELVNLLEIIINGDNNDVWWIYILWISFLHKKWTQTLNKSTLFLWGRLCFLFSCLLILLM